MKTTTTLALLSLALCCASAAHADSFGSGGNAFDIEFVGIGNPGNPADTTGNPGPPYPTGSVDYVYRIGKFEVSRDMVTKANAEGNLGVTLHPMGFVTGGPRPNMPATGVSWNEAARFVNWLNTSDGFSPAYRFSMQPGDVGYNANANIDLWQAGDPGFNAANPFRNSLAHYFLPSVDEWYKAAYYDPNADGDYWNFPTGSDSAPVAVPSGTDPGTAVYGQSTARGPADITQAGGLSPYGVMGLGGNASEWEETNFYLINDSTSSVRAVRGGRWFLSSFYLQSSVRNPSRGHWPTDEFFEVGFRVASIHQPNSRADFDEDGDVDGDDFLIWQIDLGNTTGIIEADADNDGDVDGDDFLIWQSEFGSGSGSASAAVPEPASTALLIAALVGAVLLSRRH